MKKIMLFMLISVFWPGVSFAETLEEFSNRMSNFYQAPTKAAFEEFQKSADQFQEELAASGNGSDLLIAVMIARIAEKNGWPISESAYAVAAKDIIAGKSELAQFVADDTMVSPAKLDIWWASFFATGDETYLDKIYRYAGLELPKSDMNRMLIIGAATWSFKANCRQHQSVLAYARRKVESATGPQLTYLQETIAFAEEGMGQ
jgi:hypothetical protein